MSIRIAVMFRPAEFVKLCKSDVMSVKGVVRVFDDCLDHCVEHLQPSKAAREPTIDELL